MSATLFLVSLVAAMVVVFRSVCVAAHLSRKGWDGHLWQFVGIAMSYALIAGGAVAVVLHWHGGATLLLLGMCGWILMDRRNRVTR